MCDYQDEIVLSHFKEETTKREVKHCEIATTLACYFYAFKFLDLISRHPTAPSKLSVPFGHVICRVMVEVEG